jgi:hypothetical protein
MTAPLSAAETWFAVRRFAEERGWQVELTPRGRTRCSKGGSIVLGPGHGADVTAYADLIARLGYADAFMESWRGRRP